MIKNPRMPSLEVAITSARYQFLIDYAELIVNLKSQVSFSSSGFKYHGCISISFHAKGPGKQIATATTDLMKCDQQWPGGPHVVTNILRILS